MKKRGNGYTSHRTTATEAAGCWTYKCDCHGQPFLIQFIPVWNSCIPGNSPLMGAHPKEHISSALRCQGDIAICVPVKLKDIKQS